MLRLKGYDNLSSRVIYGMKGYHPFSIYNSAFIIDGYRTELICDSVSFKGLWAGTVIVLYIQLELRGSAGGDELWEFSSADYCDNSTLLQYLERFIIFNAFLEPSINL